MTTPTLTNVNDAVTPMVAAKPDPPLRQTAGQRKAARKRAAKPEVAVMNLDAVTAELDELVRKDHKSTADRKRLEALQNREAFLLGNPNSAPVAAIPAETVAKAEPVVAAAPVETTATTEPAVTAPAVKPPVAPQPKAGASPIVLTELQFDRLVSRIQEAAENVAIQKDKGLRELAMKGLNAVLDEFRGSSFFVEREEVIRTFHNSPRHSREDINAYYNAQRQLGEVHPWLAQFSLGHSGKTAQILAGSVKDAEKVLALGLRKGHEASHSFGAQMGAAVVRLNIGGFDLANKDTVLADLKKDGITKMELSLEGLDGTSQSAWTALWDFLGASEATGRNELVNLLAAGMMVKKYRAIIEQAEAESPKQAE